MLEFMNEDQKLLQETLRDFLRKKVVPYAQRWDQEKQFPVDVVRELGALGFLGILIPEEYGGGGLDYRSLVIVVEEAARVDGSMALTLSSHNSLCSGHLLLAGSEQQKQKYLPRLATGEYLGAWGLTEPSSGSDAASMRSSADRTDGGWILNGSKAFITQGSVGHLFVILASTNPDKGAKGITAFVVERDTPGLILGKPEDKLGCRSSDTAQITMDNLKVNDDQVIGEVDQGFVDALKLLDKGRVMIGAMAVGLARGALKKALAYSRDRTQFGQPIGDFQAIQWLLADSATELAGASMLVWQAATMLDQGEFAKKEASIAKLFSSEVAMDICHRAIQIHGGYGYMKEYDVERAFRDAKICEIGEGTSEIQREVIASTLLSPQH